MHTEENDPKQYKTTHNECQINKIKLKTVIYHILYIFKYHSMWIEMFGFGYISIDFKVNRWIEMYVFRS